MTAFVSLLLLIGIMSLIAMGVFMILDNDFLVDLFAILGLLACGVGIIIIVIAFIINITFGNW